MKKIKAKITAYFKRILGITALEETINSMRTKVVALENESKTQRGAINQIKEKHNFLMSNFFVGVDVNRYEDGGTWAIVVIKNPENGKDAIYHLGRLGQGEIREIESFLRHFEKKNISIDAPPGMRKWFF